MKKFISVMLAAIMVFALSAPAAAVSETQADYPTIYIRGAKATKIYNADGSLAIKPDSTDIGAYIEAEAGPVLEDFGKAVATGEYSQWIDSLAATMGYLYDEWTINGDGEPANGSYTKADQLNANVAKKTNNFGATDYVFEYDWRLNLMETADKLDEYIERVLEVTGAKKVNIFARCLGTQPAMAYLYESYNGEYGHDFRVANVAFDTPSTLGYITLGALLSNSISLNPDSIDKFVSYFLENKGLFENSEMNDLAAVFVSIFNQLQVLGFGTDVIAKVLEDCGDELISKLALACYGGYPAYYSMVSDKYYDKAINTVFYTDELQAEYSGFIEDTREYHYALNSVNEETGLTGAEQLLLDLQKKGVNTAVFAKYGSMQFPLFEGCEITGDMRGTATELSLGAVAAKIDEKLPEEYLAAAEANGTAKYISPDRQIDASTCLFPDTTWFIKNIAHDNFPASVNAIALEFFRSNGTVTVWSSEADHTQYMDYSTGTLTELVVKNPDNEDNTWASDWMEILRNFIKSILDFFKNLFTF